MASKKEPRYTQDIYGNEDDGAIDSEVFYGGKKIMKNAPVDYSNELQRELGRAKTMQKVNYPEEKGPSKQSLQEAADEAMRRKEERAPTTRSTMGSAVGNKKGGKIKCMAKGGSASKRADGCAQRGKTRGRIV